MGLFTSKEIKKEIKKYSETISRYDTSFREIDKIISDRIEIGRIIKDVKIGTDCFLILYDYEAEERRRQEELEKQNSKDSWTQKIENDKNNSNGWER